jgi:GTP cyclohydrolase I|tara:strand:+ start:2694 stop:3545 length:852 start_codon:yes stop_codon:yes gene_type:complete
MNLPDIQTTKPKINKYINKVGVNNIRVPAKVRNKHFGSYDVVANTAMYVDLAADVKGVSMSRFIRTLQNHLNEVIGNNEIKTILKTIQKELGNDSKCAYIEMDFEIPVIQTSPKSKRKFPQYYDVGFRGSLIDGTFKFYQIVNVQYLSCCPCSAELSKHLETDQNSKGYPHAQRSLAKVIVETKLPNRNLWLEDIIHYIEEAVVTIPYPIILRPDEQEVARLAAENTQFVEDSIRSISKTLDEDKRILNWIIKCEHFESIHKSNAIAIMYKNEKWLDVISDLF